MQRETKQEASSPLQLTATAQKLVDCMQAIHGQSPAPLTEELFLSALHRGADMPMIVGGHIPYIISGWRCGERRVPALVLNLRADVPECVVVSVLKRTGIRLEDTRTVHALMAQLVSQGYPQASGLVVHVANNLSCHYVASSGDVVTVLSAEDEP
jgi:hypothetical protein